MEASNKKRIIIWSSVALILSVGGYFGYKWLKDNGKLGGNKGGGNTGDGNTGDGNKGGGNTGDGNTGDGNKGGGNKGGGNTGGGSKPTAEQTALATAYRIWANSTDDLSKRYGKKSTYDLDASRTNPYGGTFTASYKAGKAGYEASLKGVSATVIDSVLSDIEFIISNSKTTKSKQYLIAAAPKNPTYITSWAAALRNSKTTFLFANQIYASDSGEKVYNSNPKLADNWYASGGSILKTNPTNNSLAFTVVKNTSLGKVKDIKYTNEGLWFYLPDHSTHFKWTKSNWVKSSKY